MLLWRYVTHAGMNECCPLTPYLSCVASSQSHLSGRTTFFVARALLGLLEGYVSSRMLVTFGPWKAYKNLCSEDSSRMSVNLQHEIVFSARLAK